MSDWNVYHASEAVWSQLPMIFTVTIVDILEDILVTVQLRSWKYFSYNYG